MTDFAPHDQWLVGHDFTDYFFVANEKMKNYLINKNIPISKVFVTGIPISDRFLKTYDRQEILDRYNLSNNKKTVLFFAGGEFGLGKSRTAQIFEDFVNADSNIQIVAIAGRNQKMKEKFESIVNENQKADSVRILEFTNEVPELMSISDLVVTKPGGLTTSESLASHLPMVIINPIPGQEEENAEFLESHGIAVWIKKDDNSKSVINNLLNNSGKLASMRENTNILAKPNSTKNICEILIG